MLDAAILHGIFGHAVERDWIVKNPVRMEGRPGGDTDRGLYQPFKASELKRLRDAAGADMLTFLLLRHTGMRGSDAVDLRLGRIDFDSREISRLTQKRRKRVMLPIHEELFFALEAERDRRKPQAGRSRFIELDERASVHETATLRTNARDWQASWRSERQPASLS